MLLQQTAECGKARFCSAPQIRTMFACLWTMYRWECGVLLLVRREQSSEESISVYVDVYPVQSVHFTGTDMS